jgi:hypothetical protein
VRTWARLVGAGEAAELLQETLDEESDADERLTQLAESFVNPQAESGDADSNGSMSSRSAGSKKSPAKKSGAKSGGKKTGGSKSRR